MISWKRRRQPPHPPHPPACTVRRCAGVRTSGETYHHHHHGERDPLSPAEGACGSPGPGSRDQPAIVVDHGGEVRVHLRDRRADLAHEWDHNRVCDGGLSARFFGLSGYRGFERSKTRSSLPYAADLPPPPPTRCRTSSPPFVYRNSCQSGHSSRSTATIAGNSKQQTKGEEPATRKGPGAQQVGSLGSGCRDQHRLGPGPGSAGGAGGRPGHVCRVPVA